MSKAFPGVTAVENAGNIKTGPLSITHASQRSCPNCPWLTFVFVAHKKQRKPHLVITGTWKRACYANNGQMQWTTNRLNREAQAFDLSADDLARNEARAIDTLSGKNVLRLKGVGDTVGNKRARILSRACKRYSAKHGKPVYGYTHGWRETARKPWQEVSILASCESFEDARRALMRGYAAAIVVPEKHASRKAYKVDDLLAIPCPQQTGASENCLSCKLCFDDRALWQRKAVIAFEPDHGTEKTVKQTLIQIGGL